jgi:hypothetical protein
VRPPGYNPIRYNCEKQGCFNKHCRPKIEVFAGCFPGRINFGDIDACVELNEWFLFLEWKRQRHDFGGAQRKVFQRLTKANSQISAVVVCGDPLTMQIDEISVIKNGEQSGWTDCSLQKLQASFDRWAHRVAPDRWAASDRPFMLQDGSS